MAEAGSQARFLEGSLFRHVTVMSLTASVGLMAVFAVDFVNMIFISMLGRADLTAAIGYAGAILFFTLSFGIGMGIGVGALTARALGARDPAEARRRATNGLILGVAFGAAVAALVWLSLSPLVTLLGATGRTHELTVHYLRIVVPSQPLLMVGMIGGAILRSHGDARRAMLATVLGGLANAILDPILIFGFGWELTGAAVSSVVARIVIAAVALLPILRHHGGFDRPRLGAVLADLRPVFAIAFPAILTQVAAPVGAAFVTRAMASYGEAAVAGMAITGRMTPVAFGVIFALSGSIGPIIGQNYGAGRMDRVKRAFHDGLIFTALVIVAVSILLFALRSPIADLFSATDETRALIYLFCGPLSLAFFFNGVIFVSNAACNNLGRPFLSTLVSWGRHTLGTVPFAVGFGALYGAPGVLIGQAMGGLIFGAIAWVLALRAIANPAPRPAPGPAVRAPQPQPAATRGT